MMDSGARVFQISGIKIPDKKRVLLRGIHQLSGKYAGGSVYQSACTHLIIPQVLANEKFLSSCAAGKWVVTPDYVLDSVRNNSWLPEGPYEVAIPTDTTSAFYPVRHWREKVTSGAITGAFQGWRVFLMFQDSSRLVMFKRVLEAGSATVYTYPTPFHASITHIIAKPMTQDANCYNAPCFPVTHIVQYLFGRYFVDMKLNITEGNETEEASGVNVDFSQLEVDLRNHAIKQEGHPRLLFLEFLGILRNYDPHRPLSRANEIDFINIDGMIQGGLFIEALDTIRSALFPGNLPPAPYLMSLIKYAQQGSATTTFLRNFKELLHRLLDTNPPWLATANVKKFYSQVLQCPHCQTGQWNFLETAISYCLSSEATCHRLRGPGLSTLLHFHIDVLELFLKLFQGELFSLNAGDFRPLPEPGVCQETSASVPLLYGTFWTVWERSTLLSCAIKELVRFMMQAASGGHTDSNKKHQTQVLSILLDLLSVLVEFWCTQHFKLNQKLMEKGVKDLAEHFAIKSQHLTAVVLAEMVAKISSTRLKLALLDAIFSNICCKNGITLVAGPLSLKKVVLSYLPALDRLAQSHSWTQHTTNSCASKKTNCRTLSPVKNESGKECIPRAFNKGSELLQQTDQNGRTALDLVANASQRAELIHSAQVGDTCLKSKKLLNHALLEAGSCMLAHLIVCYEREKRPPSCTHPADMAYTLARFLEAHSFQSVTQGWMDQRAIRLASDTQTLLEMARGKHWRQVCEAVKSYQGENTLLLMQMLETLQSEGQVLLAEINSLKLEKFTM